MGVPAFYRWLSEKYPKIVDDVLEERVELAGGHGSIRVPFDATRPNPSGLEADNLYVDMNGIIHPCSHPENGPQPKNEQEMYENVCLYVDRLVRAVRPRKLLHLAIDGVAPRAKMNQQRSRRFRSAQEAQERAATEVEVRDSLAEQGRRALGFERHHPRYEIMIDLSEYVRFYIRKRLATDPAWRDLKVIFSDASVPGEGEHKIMSHVRAQRSQEGYNPNLVHVLHGLDADLIMLALATHEAHFYILREEVLFGRKSVESTERRREECGFAMKQKMFDEAVGSEAMELPENCNKPLQRLSVPVLREYLANEFATVIHPPFKGEVSFERLVDDIVFLCFFVGNDFLPHLPSLDIRDGALDFLFNAYRRLLPGLGGYLTDHGGTVNLDRVDVILAEVGAIEDHVFEMKHKNEENDKSRREFYKKNKMQGGDKLPAGGIVNAPQQSFGRMGRAGRIMLEKEAMAAKGGSDGDVKLQRGHSAKEELRKSLKGKKSDASSATTTSAEDNARAADALKRQLMQSKDDGSGGGDAAKVDAAEGEKDENGASKRKASEISPPDEKTTASNDGSDDDEADMFGESEEDNGKAKEGDIDMAGVFATPEEEKAAMEEAKKKMKERIKAVESSKLDDYAKNVKDNVRLHQPGWKDRYYTDKCKADDVKNHGGREHLFRSYVVGLCWVMKYYYEGCPSWKWYYPFHYGPFASDLRNIERFAKDCESFDLAEPFKPVEQLLAVLPEDSSHAVPKGARWLMGDDESPIIDFYPKDVPCDPNGKAMPWLWVVLLPFIDQERLLAALHPTMKKWTQKELLCNSRGLDDGYVFLHKDNALSKKTTFILTSKDEYAQKKFSLADKDIGRISCFFGSLRKPLSHEIHDLEEDSTVPLPASSSRISRASDLFSDPIEPNEAVCFAFTEPDIKHHRSEILRGAILPPSILTDEDRRIRRPRLNRGGETIANLGGGNQSHRSGYGSMNISSYERDLAAKTGRGRQMNQAGTRSWGSMEPTPKRFHGGGHQRQFPTQVPTIQRWQQPPPPAFPPPPPHPTQQWQQQPPPGQQYGQGYHQQQQPAYNANAGAYNQQTMRAMVGNNYNRTQQQQQQQQWRGNTNYTKQQHNAHPYQQQNRSTQQQQLGYSANNYNQPNQHTRFNQQEQQRHQQQPPPQQQRQQATQSNFSFNRQGIHQQQQPQTGGKANLSNLRAQLMSTLQKQRKGN
eukprot:CAMPEP_0181096886 /NCGR_PEP_ID=MMETSP1071-20121207/11269_1 /TAXON_ID=35127 /ORGANISM="Thalassiosira sp., Strain NH16" /LENGTH=1201 /DNA_ID=CAMNT_0023179319 /DNA_START=75 /DNA_END=3681 /DNA_ORIENTATION=+